MAAQAVGGMPEKLPESLSPTVTQPDSLTGSGSASSVTSANPTSVPTNNGVSSSSSDDDNNDNGDDQAKRLSRVAGIIGGIIGGLVFLAASGIGVWVLYRKRAMPRIDGDHPDEAGDHVGTVTASRESKPPMMELHVSLFHPFARLVSDRCRQNPFDPFTFPSQNDYGTSEVHVTPPKNGQFTGAAEL